MIRITIACPAQYIQDANQLAACLGFSMADAETYGPAVWQDSTDNLYSCASLDVSEEWFTAAQQPLIRPDWDIDNQINMDAASRAQALIVVSQETILATPSKITVIAGMEGVTAIQMMGISAITLDINK